MNSHAKNLIITSIVLVIVIILMIGENYQTTPEMMGTIIGSIIIPLFNAHMLVKYIRSEIIKQNALLAMISIGAISLLINSVLVLFCILGAMLLRKMNKSTRKSKND